MFQTGRVYLFTKTFLKEEFKLKSLKSVGRTEDVVKVMKAVARVQELRSLRELQIPTANGLSCLQHERGGDIGEVLEATSNSLCLHIIAGKIIMVWVLFHLPNLM